MGVKPFLIAIVLVVGNFYAPSALSQPKVFHTAAATQLDDHRRTYSYRLLELALSKTVSDYGPFELTGIPNLTPNRMHMINKSNSIENFFAKFTYDTQLSDSSIYAPYPVEFGLMSYRVCFVAPQFLNTSNSITSLQQMTPYTIGQGSGWPDTPVMRANGLQVKEVIKSNKLITMTEKGRFEFFCRGITEPKLEMERYGDGFPLVLNSSFMLHYELPRFFYTHKSNTAGMKRVREGLARAYKDGSAQALFRELYKDHFAFVKPKDRHVIPLVNSSLQGIDESYRGFNFQPKDL